MRMLAKDEGSMCGGGLGGMSGQCVAEAGLNYAVTGGAIAVAVVSGGLLGFASLAGAALSWSNWYRDCGPSANYGN